MSRYKLPLQLLLVSTLLCGGKESKADSLNTSNTSAAMLQFNGGASIAPQIQLSGTPFGTPINDLRNGSSTAISSLPETLKLPFTPTKIQRKTTKYATIDYATSATLEHLSKGKGNEPELYSMSREEFNRVNMGKHVIGTLQLNGRNNAELTFLDAEAISFVKGRKVNLIRVHEGVAANVGTKTDTKTRGFGFGLVSAITSLGGGSAAHTDATATSTSTQFITVSATYFIILQ